VNNKNRILYVVSAIMLGIGLTIPAFAQDTSGNPPVPASTSMHRAGEATEKAATNAYEGTATALDDTTITAELKAAFARGKDIKSNDIHVTTTAGVVNLSGQVQSDEMAARVAKIARDTKGVRGVINNLRVSSPASHN